MQQQYNINVKPNDPRGVHADMHSMQSPIFNIHIHVPAYQGDNVKMYLPRIQPVIHLHFDELARTLEKKQGQQNKNATYRRIQQLLGMTSPRFGEVRFHYKDKQNKMVNRNKEFECQDKRSETVNRSQQFSKAAPSVSLNYSNDARAYAKEKSIRLGNQIPGNCGMPDCCGSQSSVEDSDSTLDDSMSETDSNSEETLKQKFNLKEAVVVLEDVCKTEYYKNMVAAGLIRDSTIDSMKSECESECDDLIRQVENTIPRILGDGNIKHENESLSPESSCSSGGKAFSENFNTNYLNPSNQILHKLLLSSPATKKTRLTENESNTGVAGGSEKTLSALAKGCNFSDILSRFQIKKCEESDDDSVKCIEDITQSDGLRSNEGCNYNERVVEHLSCDEPVMRRTSFQRTIGNPLQPSNRIQANFGTRRESFIKTNKPNGSLNEYKEIGPEDTALKAPSNKLNLDAKAWTSQQVTSKSRLEMISTLSPTWHKRILMFPETRESRLINMGVSGFRLDVIEDVNVRGRDSRRGVPSGKMEFKKKFFLEMGRRNNGRTGINLKKTASEMESSSSKKSAPSKKRKRSNDESRKPRTPSVVEDYIPLQASGPTKFVVAPLSKVNPYKTHDARTFKTNMLYGNRINRFSSSDQLRIYQLKQEAAKTQSN